MASKIVNQVCTFNRELLGIKRPNPALLPDEEANWLKQALTEEIKEFDDAHRSGELVPTIDALVDLIYFAIGGLYRCGLNPMMIDACFEVVHDANMQKRKGQKATRPTDGSVADAVKSEVWADPAPLIKSIIWGDYDKGGNSSVNQSR